MKPIRAGKLNKRIVIEQANDGEPATDGQPEITWVTLAERWASVEPLETSGREYLLAANVESEASHVVELRWLANVTSRNRINCKGRILEIESVSDIEERGRKLVLFCREQTGR